MYKETVSVGKIEINIQINYIRCDLSADILYKERDSVSRPTLYKYSISTLESQLIDIADYICTLH